MHDDGIRSDCAWLSVSEAARIAGVHRYTVYNWIERGRLQALPGDDGYRIKTTDLNRYLATRRAAAAVGIRMGTLLMWADRANGPASELGAR
jgi:excisionase family DNA binding protein